MCHLRLETICDKLLSSFAFNLNLRRFNMDVVVRLLAAGGDVDKAGAYTRPLFGST
jgi:hypothetical protein